MEVILSIRLMSGFIEIDQKIDGRESKPQAFFVHHLDNWTKSLDGSEDGLQYQVMMHSHLELFWFEGRAYVLYSQTARPELELTPIISCVYTLGGKNAIRAMLP